MEVYFSAPKVGCWEKLGHLGDWGEVSPAWSPVLLHRLARLAWRESAEGSTSGCFRGAGGC